MIGSTEATVMVKIRVKTRTGVITAHSWRPRLNPKLKLPNRQNASLYIKEARKTKCHEKNALKGGVHEAKQSNRHKKTYPPPWLTSTVPLSAYSSLPLLRGRAVVRTKFYLKKIQIRYISGDVPKSQHQHQHAPGSLLYPHEESRTAFL